LWAIAIVVSVPGLGSRLALSGMVPVGG
jgi:hypothetical protein